MYERKQTLTNKREGSHNLALKFKDSATPLGMSGILHVILIHFAELSKQLCKRKKMYDKIFEILL